MKCGYRIGLFAGLPAPTGIASGPQASHFCGSGQAREEGNTHLQPLLDVYVNLQSG